MAKINPRQADGNKKELRFGGVRSRDRISDSGCSEMRNFHLLSDGSLEKRCGIRTWLTLSGPIRGTWEGALNGEGYFFAVAGNTVYCIKPQEREPSAIYVLPTSIGSVSFVYYKDRLYLLDGSVLLIFRSSTQTFHTADGYTPLYGRNWHPTELGKVHEPLNLIQNRIRLHYLNTVSTTEFRLPFTAKSIDRMKINGTYITDYSFTPYTASFRIPPDQVGGTVEVAVTLDDIFNQRPTVLRANHALVYKDPHHESFFSYGGALGYRIYRSGVVSNDMLAASTAVYGSSDPLYIPSGNIYTAGSTQAPVTAVLQNGEQLLVLNHRTLWAIRFVSDSSDDAVICLLRDGIGCVAEGGALNCGEDPVLVQSSGIVKLHFSSGDPDDFSVSNLSEDISDRLNASFLQHALLFWQASANRLWVRNQDDMENLVWIYDLTQKQWVTYDNMNVVYWFEHQNEVGFGTTTGKLCICDSTLELDDENMFHAEYVSHYLFFPYPELFLRSLRLSLCADSNGSDITLIIETDKDHFRIEFIGTEVQAPQILEHRLSTGRFRFLRFRIIVGGIRRSRIHFLSIAANQ